MYLTRRAELAEAAALISPLELPPTMRSAGLAAEAAAGGRRTSLTSIAGSTLPHIIDVIAGTAPRPQLSDTVAWTPDTRCHRAHSCLVYGITALLHRTFISTGRTNLCLKGATGRSLRASHRLTS